MNLQKLFKIRFSEFSAQLKHSDTILQIDWHDFFFVIKIWNERMFLVN
jgi:hypothetical protein